MLEHNLLRNSSPLRWRKTSFSGASSSNINKHQLLFTKYGSGFLKRALSPQDVGKSPQKAEHPLPLASSLHNTRPPRRPTSWLPPPHSPSLSEGSKSLDLELSKCILGELSSLGQFGAFSPTSMQLKALSVHPWSGRMQRVISDLEQTLYVVQETQPERLKALMSRKRQSINLSPTWWQMEKEILYTRFNLSINYSPICAYQGLLKCWLIKSSRTPILSFCLRQWWKICVTEEPRVSLLLSRTQSHSLMGAGWRGLGSRRVFNQQPLVQVCRVQEQIDEPLHALCVQRCALTPSPPSERGQSPKHGINTALHY